MIHAKKGMYLKVDLGIALLLMLSVVLLFVNGDHVSPRQRLYEEKVGQINTLIYDRVLESQTWFVANQPTQISLGTDKNNLPWNVAKTPKKALKSVMNTDFNAKKQIDGYASDFHKWEKDNKYSDQEIKQYKAKLYVLTDDQRNRYQLRLNQLRVQYKKAVKNRFAELDKLARARETSLVAAQRYASSVSASVNQQAEIAASMKAKSESEVVNSTTAQSEVGRSLTNKTNNAEQDSVNGNATNSQYSDADANESSDLSSSYESSSEVPEFSSSSETVDNDTINN